MENENTGIQFIDAEFQTSGNQKIDYKSILFKQIDYIRFLRTQDMGQIAIFGINLEQYTKSEQFFTWITNIQKYENSVLSLKSLLISYQDDEYTESMKRINKSYTDKLNTNIIKLKNRFEKQGKSKQEFLKQVDMIKRTFELIERLPKFDEIFEETILLANRAKFIGGNDYIEEVME